MSETVKPPRRAYDSSRRQEQARQTRRDILRAAHDLFVTHGYGRTTIADVARAAGVSAETIYATYKNKATLLDPTETPGVSSMKSAQFRRGSIGTLR